MLSEVELKKIRIIHGSQNYKDFREKMERAGFTRRCGKVVDRDGISVFSERFYNENTGQVIHYECKVSN